MQERDVWERLRSIDPKIIYTLLIICVSVPLVRPLGLPLTISAETRAAYDFIEKLPEGSPVLLSVGTDPQTEAETWAQAVAMGRHLLSKKCPLVFLSVNSVGQPYAQRLAQMLMDEYKLEYGKDIAVLQFRAGEETAVAGFANDFKGLYNVDYKGTPVEELPLLQELTAPGDFKLIIDYQYKSSAIWFARHVGGPLKVAVIAGSRAASAPNMMPYYASGQFSGVLAGVQGAAAYERLIGRPDTAAKGMDAQSMGLVMIVLVVIIGNIAGGFARKDRAAGVKS